MEGLYLLKNILEKGDYFCKLDLKRAYFCLPLNQDSQKFLHFEWNCTFRLGPGPRLFTNLLKVKITILRKPG